MRHDKAGLRLSVSRVEKAVRRGLPEKRMNDRAPVYLTGVLESLTQTLLHQAADNAAQKKSRRVNPVDLIKAVRHDPDFSRAFGGFAFSSLLPCNKPIDHILVQEGPDGQKARRDRIRQKKIERAEEKAKKQASKA